MMRNQRTWDNPDQMLGVDEALGRILAQITPLPARETPIVESLGMVAADATVATVAVPPFRNSAMDGYALRSVDTLGDPTILRVVATVAAGHVATRGVGVGEAMRIMTGAPLPDGADAVVRFEETDEMSRTAVPLTEIGISRSIQSGENVRQAGEDIGVGDHVVPAGTTIGPAEIGVLASLNMQTVRVHRRPRVAILSTGDEVVEPGEDLRPGQIRNSNSYMLAALVRRVGGDPILLGIARDTTEDVHSSLQSTGRPDLFVTSGGVSVGDYDIVKDVLQREGSIDIWEVRMKPGKPLAFGTIGGVPLLGLPGNPVAAFVSFEQFGRPAIRRMLGHTDVRLPEVTATLAETVNNAGRRRHYLRGVIERTSAGLEVRPAGRQGSALLMAAVHANCFIVVPETCESLDAGDSVRVQLLEVADVIP